MPTNHAVNAHMKYGSNAPSVLNLSTTLKEVASFTLQSSYSRLKRPSVTSGQKARTQQEQSEECLPRQGIQMYSHVPQLIVLLRYPGSENYTVTEKHRRKCSL